MAEEKKYFREINLNKNPLGLNFQSILSNLDIELTERCNNNCIHCYINKPEGDELARERELSASLIKDIMSEAASLGCFSVRLTGGEPLLRQDFEDIYLSARKLGMKVLLYTNACMITEDIAKLFSRIPPLEEIEVSVYGMKKKSYESITRRTGSFEQAWNGINLLLKYNIPFTVKGVLLPGFMGDIEDFEKWASENVNGWVNNKAGNYSEALDFRARRDLPEKNKIISELRLSHEHKMRIFSSTSKNHISEMKKFCAQCLGQNNGNLFSCGAGVKHACIDAYGKLQMCLLLRHPETVYEIKKGNLKDAMLRVFPKIREIKPQCDEYLLKCAKCFIRGLCLQCPAKSYMEYGVLDKPVKYLCESAHAEARFLGLLNEGEKAWETDGNERVEKFIKDN